MEGVDTGLVADHVDGGGRLVGLGALSGSAEQAAAVLLLLHGGRVDSHEPVSRANMAAARMDLMARRLRRGRPALPVLALRYRVRGWNDADGARMPDPVRDAFGALSLIEQRLGPVPVILVGHSLGGRAAVRVAGHHSVRAVAALAPWLPAAEPVESLAGRTLLIVHGRRDRVTDPRHSLDYARRASATADAVYLKFLDDGHAMMRAPGVWHRLVAQFAATVAFGSQSGELDAERIGAR